MSEANVRVITIYEPDPPGHLVVNVTSRSEDMCRQLSPFFLGPCHLYAGYEATCVENGWQFSKLHRQHADDAGQPTDAYFEWAQVGWADNRAHRYPMGKGARPLCSVWDGDLLGYVDARKRIYVPMYAARAVETEAFSHLRNVVDSGRPVALRDFDAYDREGKGMSLSEALDFDGRSFGHGFVLEMLLRRDEASCRTCGIWHLVS